MWFLHQGRQMMVSRWWLILILLPSRSLHLVRVTAAGAGGLQSGWRMKQINQWSQLFVFYMTATNDYCHHGFICWWFSRSRCLFYPTKHQNHDKLIHISQSLTPWDSFPFLWHEVCLWPLFCLCLLLRSTFCPCSCPWPLASVVPRPSPCPGPKLNPNPQPGPGPYHAQVVGGGHHTGWTQGWGRQGWSWAVTGWLWGYPPDVCWG